MSWFKREKAGITVTDKKALPDGLWIKCENCGEVLYKKELERQYSVCSKCGFHFRITCNEYIALICDEGSFVETFANIRSADPLKFKDSERYIDRIKKAMQKTGMTEAVKTGTAAINGIPVVLGVMDFRFVGGSMGSVVGEKIARATMLALEKRLPLIIVSASGGARMQESAYSLMQMAKTSARLAMLAEARLPYISILTHPTTGGVTASFSMLGDVILAEPGALIGFAGPRVIKQTIGQDLPEGFQRAEFLLEHGFIDAVIHRKELKQTLYSLLTFFLDEAAYHQN
ncbi:MAG: acetyl-CoA carboxylase, carboxyltransferase subunit beta [candidate division KSB1 bacterium]|nr:acetyl-CoA carboxylase, carboxyltransferase subunit beta [candidate division KSB1 bacterium]MDZ7346769.1 acetyl-CoA carboxylase, carboxyltransferase subunit beta [candidate division KSB1 bacterium]